MTDEPTEPSALEVWFTTSLADEPRPSVRVILQTSSDASTPSEIPARASVSGGPLCPYRHVRLRLVGVPPPVDQAALPSVSPTSVRVQVDGHRAKIIPGEHPQIELLAAGKVVGRCRFHQQAPAPFAVRDAQSGVLELNYDLDVCDLLLAILNNKQRPVWMSEELGLEA